MIPIEKYNRFGQLIITYPSVEIAAAENGLTVQALKNKLHIWDENSKEQFKYADAADEAKNSIIIFPWVQLKDNKPINQFRTLQEASEQLGFSKSQIERWVKNKETDNFGCSWIKVKK